MVENQNRAAWGFTVVQRRTLAIGYRLVPGSLHTSTGILVYCTALCNFDTDTVRLVHDWLRHALRGQSIVKPGRLRRDGGQRY